jgi:multidrug efflux system outer membrane protein
MKHLWPIGVIALASCTLLTNCKMGPDYKRPTVPTPPAFRNGEAAPTAASLADTKWFDLFQDDVLKQLVETALAQNHDLNIAAERVLQARAANRRLASAALPARSTSTLPNTW